MKIQVIKEKKGYSGIIKELGVYTQGDTLDELIKNIKEAGTFALKDKDNKKNLQLIKMNFFAKKEFSMLY